MPPIMAAGVAARQQAAKLAGMTQFVLTWLVLTMILNVGLRVIPGASERLTRWVQSMTDRANSDQGGPGGADETQDGEGQSRVQVVVPWKAMLIVSIGLTVVLNLIAVLR